ncbi:PAS domain S-box protein [Desulfoprunum benzoelyticum]|uniref:histidine kinase n=1 Tax=Desulfoprunum benzoelyticum TaxID=1506996 RepID=A0A840UYU6_9BACT|nr:PAS domain-containing sensor histidine kinase [Desulfoprunum benzoelyticum]MBB5347828.1 PAS domain S-box-containing protein [Desulfoprunum benzoelyticum]MBM9530689.1 PAS domain S-box protein [Desulfoprunum benzoelyticum]
MNSKGNRSDQAAALADTIGLSRTGTDRGESAPAMQTLRHQAGEIRNELTALSEQGLKALSPDTTLQILLELQTRQLELESRIERLSRTQAAEFRRHPVKETTESGLQLLSVVLDALPIGVAITDTKGGCILTNAAYEQVWGNPRPEARSVDDYAAYRAWWDGTGKPVAPEEWASAVASRQGEAAVGQVMRLQRFDGSEIFVINSASPIHDGKGAIVGSAVAIQDITEMKQAELALRQKEEDFARAQAVGSIGSWRFDVRRNVLIWSDETYRIFGIPAGTPLTYETFLSKLHPQDRAGVNSSWKEALRGKPYDVEHRIVVDDQVKWVREKAYLELDHENRVVGGFGITQDISERKLVEAALRQSEERYRLLAETMLQGVVHQDGDGTIIAMNHAAENILGKSRAEFLNITSVDTEHDTIRDNGEPFPGLEHPSMIALQTGKPVRHVVMGVFNPRLGAYRWIRIDAMPVFAQGEDAPSEVYTVFEDITEHREAEAALRKNERTMRTLIDAATESIWLFGLHGEVLAANETAASRFGMSVEELVGRKWQSFVPAELVASRTAQINEIIDSGRPVSFEDIRNGICFDHTAYPVRNDNGTITAVAFFSRDITERKLAEKALRESREQLQALNNDLEQRVERRTLELQETQRQFLHAEKLAAIGKLSASIAHEFNNPLQGIQSVLKGLRKRAILEEEDRELLEEAIKESDRIKDLIRSLQEFNRPSSGTMKLVDLHQVLDSMLLLHKSDFRRKRISLTLDYARRLPQIQAVADQIKQVLLNLLTNAVDACQQRGGVITIRTWQKDEDTVAVAIRDSGVGMKADALDRIFQPFYTTKPEVKGTGLGLSVCHGIIKKHRGAICVDSQPGMGSTFTILLPIRNSVAD